ncbi:hypothetical protein [Catenulispora rubra]|uniref:hypothetical protein n=1 Tax=Catenulispora rubra TaxID=280293 RepID=UPI0018920A5A|nr:hypothetical protein [Catenulispora rubra]
MKTPVRLLTSIASAGLLATAAGCASDAATSTDHIKSVTWDLRKKVDIKTLGIPENTFDLSEVDVSITLSDGEVYSAQHVDVMIDGDLKDPTRITTIRVGLGAQTIDQAYQTAKDLGARWHISSTYIDVWYKDAKMYPSYSGSGAGRSTLPGGNTVGLFMPVSGDFSKPVLPEFEIDNVNASDLGGTAAASPSPSSISTSPTPK